MADTDADATYQKNITIAVPLVFVILSTLVYGVRLYARRTSAARIGVDDLLMGIGLLLSFGATAGVVSTGFNGAGRPVLGLPKPERQRFNEGKWILQKFWPTSLAFIKCSIIVFMQRLFKPHTRFNIASNVLIAFVALRETAAVLTNTFQCWPPQFFYNKTIKGGHCMKGQNKFYITMGALSMIEDVVILVMPQPVIWGLHLSMRKKIGLAIVFSLGSLVAIFSLLRLIEFHKYEVSNLPASSVLEGIFSCLEINMAIICGCLPPTSALLQTILPKSLLSKTGASSSETYHTSSTTNRYMRKGGGGGGGGCSYKPESFERIIDSKISQDTYSTPPHDSSLGMELGAVGVQTDLDQQYERRKPEDGTGVTSMAWPR